jgi:hypothetical protein
MGSILSSVSSYSALSSVVECPTDSATAAAHQCDQIGRNFGIWVTLGKFFT